MHALSQQVKSPVSKNGDGDGEKGTADIGKISDHLLKRGEARQSSQARTAPNWNLMDEIISANSNKNILLTDELLI